MKRFTKYIAFIVLAVVFTSCNEWMNAGPEGATKTSDQKMEAAAQNPSAALADLSAVYAQFIQYESGLGDLGYSRHNDFGYAAICMFMDAQSADFVSANIGYNWFGFSDWHNIRDNTLQTTDGLICHLVWNEYYKIIHACNVVIEGIDKENPGGSRAVISQAFAVRAFCYLQLAQIYQFTYGEGSLEKPCVPLVIDNMPAERAEANPRVSVKETFDFIMADLNYACDSLEGYARPDKGYVNQAVAFGLRARANLVMKNWAKAAEDADKAIALSGAQPLSMADAGVPGFASANASNVMWANIIVETNDVVQTGICNWVSHMSTFYGDGYTGVGATRWISSALYDEIPETDVRKGWWLNADRESPLLDADGYKALKADIVELSDYYPAYCNVKFGTGDGTVTGLGAAAGDWIIMRVEEMYLILAEARQRAGQDGASVLTDFVKTYRNPYYNIDAHHLSVEDEIWWQRRVELWGEGFAFSDIMRLEKPIIRTESTNWPAAWNIDVPADHDVLLWRIPQSEIEANRGISNEENNPYVPF